METTKKATKLPQNSGLEPPRTHSHEGDTTDDTKTILKDMEGHITIKNNTRIRTNILHTKCYTHMHTHAWRTGLGVEGSSPMTPRGEAPKNPAGTNALGPVGIPPKAKATALPIQNPAAAGFFFCFIYPLMAALRRGSDDMRTQQRLGWPAHANNDQRLTRR